MVAELIEMYRAGAITGYQAMLDCLHMLDPKDPVLVLKHLPDEILDEMLDFTHRYDPTCMRTASGPPPAADQVSAAQRWIEEKKRLAAEKTLAS